MPTATYTSTFLNRKKGQTGMLVTLFILVLGLIGFNIYLFMQQGSSSETFTKKFEDQDKSLRDANSTIDDLTQKIKSQKESISDLNDTLASLRTELTTTKTSLSQVQENVKDSLSAMDKTIATIKTESTQSLGSFLETSTKMDARLNDLIDQIKTLKATTTITPIIDVNMEPSTTPAKVVPKKAVKPVEKEAIPEQ